MHILASLLILCIHLTADSAAHHSFRDSIQEHYLQNGAWHYSIFSQQYEDELDSALRLDPTDAYLWQQRGMPYFKQMKYEVGMPYIDSAVKYDADQWLDYRAFLECIFQKSYRAALRDFEDARRMHPGAGVMDHKYSFYEGICYLQLCDYDSAERCFSICIDHDRSLAGHWEHYMHDFYLGVTLYEEHQYDSAIRVFDLALMTYPHFSDAKYYKAESLSALHQEDSVLPMLYEARDDLRNGFTINEDNAIYEQYPYQIRLSRSNGWIAAREELRDKKANK